MMPALPNEFEVLQEKVTAAVKRIQQLQQENEAWQKRFRDLSGRASIMPDGDREAYQESVSSRPENGEAEILRKELEMTVQKLESLREKVRNMRTSSQVR